MCVHREIMLLSSLWRALPENTHTPHFGLGEGKTH